MSVVSVVSGQRSGTWQGQQTDAHLATADGKQHGAAPAVDAGVELAHRGVEGVASATGLLHHGLDRPDLLPQPRRLSMKGKTSQSEGRT